MADRHKNRTLESEALRLQEYRAKTTDLGAVLDEAIANINWPRRRRAEGDFLYFLKVYCTNEDPAEGAFLEIPPTAADMIAIVCDMQQAIGDASIPYHIRVARGHGKTSYTKGAALWVASTGQRRFGVLVHAPRPRNVAKGWILRPRDILPPVAVGTPTGGGFILRPRGEIMTVFRVPTNS